MNRITYLLILAFSFSGTNLFAQTSLSYQVNFEYDEYDLKTSSNEKLIEIADDLTQFKEYEIEIIGHTDQDGSKEYNSELSKKRAIAVSQFFSSLGISEDNIDLKYRGESNLIDRSNDNESKFKNRRVEINVRGFLYQSIKDIVGHLNTNDQQDHHIRNSLESTINLEKGTQVVIPKDAFCHSDGSPLENDHVQLSMKEAYSYLDMVDQGLFTQTEDQLLETGGMFFISAEQNGKLLKLKEGKSIDVLLTRQIDKPGMELFLGTEDAEDVIWTETGESVQSVQKDELFIQVDVSPILNFKFDRTESSIPKMAAMPAYPHPKRKANPPARSIYTEKKYQEVYKKYEEVMKLHHEYELIRPKKIEEWKEEFAKREKILLDLQKSLMSDKIVKRVEFYVQRFRKQKDSVSHHKLLNELMESLSKDIGNVSYSKREILSAVLGKNYGEVLKMAKFEFKNLGHLQISYFFPDLLSKMNDVKFNIAERKYELGHIDERTFSRYLISTSDLGWINCDRFIKYDENELTQLEFADTSKEDKYYLIFKDIKSVIRPNKKDGKVIFNNIPKGEKVRLVVIGYNDSQAQMAFQDLTLGSSREINLKPQTVQLREIREVLKT